jgi:hypothetical protein
MAERDDLGEAQRVGRGQGQVQSEHACEGGSDAARERNGARDQQRAQHDTLAR